MDNYVSIFEENHSSQLQQRAVYVRRFVLNVHGKRFMSLTSVAWLGQKAVYEREGMRHQNPSQAT